MAKTYASHARATKVACDLIASLSEAERPAVTYLIQALPNGRFTPIFFGQEKAHHLLMFAVHRGYRVVGPASIPADWLTA